MMKQTSGLVFLCTVLLLLMAPFACSSDPKPVSTSVPTGCLAGQLACTTGCVDPLNDSGNCGACGAVCQAGTSCVNGACACPGGLSDCSGICTDLTTSAANCGSCGVACQGTQTCTAGQCQCQLGYTSCTAGCVDTLTSPGNCGTCGNVCQAGLVCSQGACAASCAAGETNCNGACIVDLTTNRENCGACGVACTSEQSCVAGACSCGAGTANCNGACVDTTSNPQNCGACGMICSGGQQCVASACACPAGQELCNGSCAAAGSCNGSTTSTASSMGGAATTTSTDGLASTMGGASSTMGGASSTMGGASSTDSTVSTTGDGGSSSSTDCTITADLSTSSAIGTVGIVTWSTDLAGLTSAEIRFQLDDGSGPERVAPVDLEESEYRTLLLGMKGNRTYNVQIFASAGGSTCSSEVYSISTGAAPGNVNVNQMTSNAAGIAPGFIILCGGIGGGGNNVYIVDEDGDVVWAFAGPQQTSRAKMDWEGDNMWMLSLNVQNGGGEMRRVSMDGLDTENNASGLSNCHHDFTVAPGGIVTCPSWSTNGMDPPSNIIERAPNGTVTTIARDADLYSSNSYHSNSIHYHASDDSYTLGDRNPNAFVKFSRSGQLQWQFGGSGSTISGLPSWQVNHGHHLLDNGNFLFFNNTNMGNSSPVFEYAISGNSASEVWSYTGGGSLVLGDIQRLDNGNTLITYSTGGSIVELDSSDNSVRTLSAGSFGYSDHRPTLYGPPAR